jgi:hypothetical protein
LVADEYHNNNDVIHQQRQPPLYSTRLEQSSRHIRPILPFLSALVRVELMSLRQDEPLSNHGNINHKGSHNKSNETKMQQPAPRLRKVQFSGFDCSSTQPPSDARLGSHLHRHRCIDALIEAMEQADALQVILEQHNNMPPMVTQEEADEVPMPTTTWDDGDKRSHIVECLQSMVAFFQDLEATQGSTLVATCARVRTSDLVVSPLLLFLSCPFFHELTRCLVSVNVVVDSLVLSSCTGERCY